MNPRNSEHLRRLKEREIFQLILSGRKVSRAELSRILGYDKTTVSSVVNILQEKGLIEEKRAGESTPRGGKKPAILGIKEKDSYIVGIWFSGTGEFEVALYDLMGRSVETRELKFEKPPFKGVFLKALSGGIKHVISRQKTRNPGSRVLAAGIALGGRVDAGGRLISSSSAWHQGLIGLELKNSIEKIAGLPVYVDNRVMLSLYFEHYLGNALKEKDFVFFQVLPFMRAFLFLNGSIHYGSNFRAGQIGASLWKLGSGRSEYLCDIVDYEMFGLPMRRNRGDKPLDLNKLYNFMDKISASGSDSKLDELARTTGELLVNIINYYDVPLIILGGISENARKKFLERAEKVMNSYLPSSDIENYRICFEKKHPNKRGLGFLCMVAEKLF